MIRTTLVATLALTALGGAFIAGRTTANHHGLTLAAQPEEMGEMTPEQVRAMMEAGAAKTPEHDTLARMVGEWDAEMNFLMEPGAEPEVSHADATMKSVLGGRFILSHYKGVFTFMGADIPFEGYGLMGYDKNRGLYVSSWCDNLSTSMLIEEGAPGDDADVISVEGESPNAMGADPRMRHVHIMNDDGSYTLEFHQPDPATGKFMKIGWINHARK